MSEDEGKIKPKQSAFALLMDDDGSDADSDQVEEAVAVGPAPAKRPKQQVAEPAVPRKQPQSAAAQGCNSMDIWELQVNRLGFGTILCRL